MVFEITFLGTSCMMPTKDRNLFSIFIRYINHGILVDCGEGTQRQLKTAGIAFSKIDKILITHWHGDHILGLPGLVQSMGASQYNGKLTIYGPKGSLRFFENMKKSFYFDIRIDVEIVEITKNGMVFEDKEIMIESEMLDHGIPCNGYSIIEKDKRKMEKTKIKNIPGNLVGMLQDGKTVDHKGKEIKPDDVSHIVKGKKISIVVDTVMCSNALKLAKGADLLISESTFTSELEEKGEQYGHMTAKQAANLANLADVKKLVLTHFSQRYKGFDEIKEDAEKIFSDVECAYDFMKIKI